MNQNYHVTIVTNSFETATFLVEHMLPLPAYAASGESGRQTSGHICDRHREVREVTRQTTRDPHETQG